MALFSTSSGKCSKRRVSLSPIPSASLQIGDPVRLVNQLLSSTRVYRIHDINLKLHYPYTILLPTRIPTPFHFALHELEPLCHHCLMLYADHATNEKCLYRPTCWKGGRW